MFCAVGGPGVTLYQLFIIFIETHGLMAVCALEQVAKVFTQISPNGNGYYLLTLPSRSIGLTINIISRDFSGLNGLPSQCPSNS